MKNRLKAFNFSDINLSSPYMVENFIISNSNDKPIDIDFKYPFSFNGIVFAFCLKGTGKIRIDLREYHTNENSLTIMLPNQVVEHIEHSNDFFVELLAFDFDFLADIPIPKDFDMPRKVAQRPVLDLVEKEAHNLLRYYSFIVETFNNNDSKGSEYFEQIVKGLLYSLLMEIVIIYTQIESNQKDKKISSRSEDIVEQFLELLKKHYKEGRTSSYYADKMFITAKYLSITLKKVTGRSINTWIEDAIIIGAKMLLKSSKLTVLQISEELNFPNASYFGRFFKRHTGMTPKGYRDN